MPLDRRYHAGMLRRLALFALLLLLPNPALACSVVEGYRVPTHLELAQRASELAGVNTALLTGRNWRELNLAAPRPTFTSLGSERGLVMPTLESALERYIVNAA